MFLRLGRAGLVGAALLSVAASATAQEVSPLGPRIGDTLDAEERAYFGLFPALSAPAPYRFRANGDSVHVTHADTTLLALPRAHADRLARLVETFEDFPSVAANPSWEASAAFVRYVSARTPVPQGSAAGEVRAVTAEGTYVGYLLYSSDSLLVMAPEIYPRDPLLPGAYVLPRDAVTALNRTYAHRWQRWGPALGAGIGIVVGASALGSDDRVAGGSFGALLGFTAGELGTRLSRRGDGSVGPEAIDDLAFFNGTRPPELPDPSAAASLLGRPLPRPRPLPRRRSHEWVSFGVHGVVSAAEPELTYTPLRVSTSVVPLRYESASVFPSRQPQSVPFRVDLSVRPVRWVRMGAYIGRSTTGDSVYTGEFQEQILRSYGPIRPYAEAVVPILRLGRQRLEVAAGGGLERYRVRSLQIAPPYVQQGAFQRPIVPATQEVQAEGTAWFVHVGAELYASPYTSLFVRHGWHPLPDLTVEDFPNLYALDPALLLRLVSGHTTRFSYREVTIGSRFHF